MDRNVRVSITVIRRLPKYYRYLGNLLDKGVNRISSQELSKITGFTASQIRQDLNHFGGFGQQGYGYNVEELREEIGKIIGLDKKYDAVIAGAGNIGQALSNYKGFTEAGFKIKCLFDKNPKLIGLRIQDMEIKDVDEMGKYIQENNIEIGIIAVPKETAQEICDILVAGGIKAIWNFAPVDLKVDDEIILENVHLNESLFTLSYFLNNKSDYVRE